MTYKLSLKKGMLLRRTAFVLLAAALIFAATGCSEEPATSPTPSATPSPLRTFAPPTATLPPSPSPSELPSESPSTAPTETDKPTPTPAPDISFPPFEKTDSGAYEFPQVLVDKKSASTGEPVYFKILTSEKVNSIRTVIDGEEQTKVYKEYTTDNGARIWQVIKVSFTKGGNRRVQFKCGMASGGTAMIPQSAIKIDVTFKYTAESTSKTISKGKTVTFTLKTPDTIDSVVSLVDGVKQEEYKEPSTDDGGVKIWKVSITFFGLGTRAVTFQAYDGTKLKKTFPDPGIPIIVQDSIS